ncbi:hypothetical protein CPAV1605_653 [seawater metagenome]|uniref:Uncharacterized protein n=1 Tax=seawater metagenome TaxID=1561972 RepID=A0A5E8CHP5_9ZZZZ
MIIMNIYQIIYIPRIQDEIVIKQSSDFNFIINFMKKLKSDRPKAYLHHYVWDLNNKKTIKLDI